VEVSQVQRRLRAAIESARRRARERRERVAAAERTYAAFLEHVATPVMRQVAGALKAEGYAFTVFTPSHGVRLAVDRGRDDFIEILLDTSTGEPQVLGRVSQTRGSRTVDDTRPVKPGASPDAITDDDVLAFVIEGLEPWL